DSKNTRAIATRAMMMATAARTAASNSYNVAASRFKSSDTETIGNSSATRHATAARARRFRGASANAVSAIAAHAKFRISSVIAAGGIVRPSSRFQTRGVQERFLVFQSPQTVSMRIAQTSYGSMFAAGRRSSK